MTYKRTAGYLLLPPLLFAVGWLAGTYGSSVFNLFKRYSAEAYLNKYNVASGADITTSTYFVTVSDSTGLLTLATQRSDILSVKPTKYDSLFHVEVDVATRRERVNEMRSLPGISTVFTVPFICH
ncbi:hypothetical protein AB833_07850 [Chromatiales bacterium (ex Bugula neritina AB1)]|nr:hypothetical protein AB833_07850 [Chromatiales bacterium (ex Bugula neritina AB1)]